MTAEHLTLLELNDLRALRIICGNCRAAITLQLDETIRVPGKCPSCLNAWDEPRFEGMTAALESLGQAVKKWRAIERQQQQPFALRFEVLQTDPPPSGRA